MQAALASAGVFIVGAALPLLAALGAPPTRIVPPIWIATLAALLLSGAVAAHAGGAGRWRAARRVAFWGALAMAATSAIGRLFYVAM